MVNVRFQLAAIQGYVVVGNTWRPVATSATHDTDNDDKNSSNSKSDQQPDYQPKKIASSFVLVDKFVTCRTSRAVFQFKGNRQRYGAVCPRGCHHHRV